MQLMKDGVERPGRLIDLDGLPLDSSSIGVTGGRIGALVAHERPRRSTPSSAGAIRFQPRRCLPAPRRRCATWQRSAAICCSVPAASISATRLSLQQVRAGQRLLGILGDIACTRDPGRQRSLHCEHPSDLAVALTALDAAVELRGSGRHQECPDQRFLSLPGDTPERETVTAAGRTDYRDPAAACRAQRAVVTT